MRKLLAIAVPLLVVGSIGLAGAAWSSPVAKTAVCDLTSSKTKPYQRIVATSAKALKAYTAKPADIIPAPSKCPTSLLTPTAGGYPLGATMVGVTEVPNPADPDGTGTVNLRLRQGQGQICESVSVSGIGQPTASHIHKGTASDSGPVVVALKTPSLSGAVSGCVVAPRDVVNAIMANPAGYYVNVHTGDYPDGAIRNQLSGPVNYLLEAKMNGANERPTAGDSDGTGMGMFVLRPDQGQLCYTLTAQNVILPTVASHIHRGDSTVAGPVIIPFTAPAANGTSEGCVTVDASLLKEIMANPGGFYANVHTTDFPGGAIRAALEVVR